MKNALQACTGFLKRVAQLLFMYWVYSAIMLMISNSYGGGTIQGGFGSAFLELVKPAGGVKNFCWLLALPITIWAFLAWEAHLAKNRSLHLMNKSWRRMLIEKAVSIGLIVFLVIALATVNAPPNPMFLFTICLLAILWEAYRWTYVHNLGSDIRY